MQIISSIFLCLAEGQTFSNFKCILCSLHNALHIISVSKVSFNWGILYINGFVYLFIILCYFIIKYCKFVNIHKYFNVLFSKKVLIMKQPKNSPTFKILYFQNIYYIKIYSNNPISIIFLTMFITLFVLF